MSKKPPNLPPLGLQVKRIVAGGSYLRNGAAENGDSLKLNAQLLAGVKGNLTVTIALSVAFTVKANAQK
jgi:hypothetical protein